LIASRTARNLIEEPHENCTTAGKTKELTVVNAIVSGGAIRPLEPLPADWREGQALRVEREDERDTAIAEVDQDFALQASVCDQSEPVGEEALQQAIEEAHRQAKEHVRRQMGLG
jgi:hypothetical protein